jgi:hypothetical protein
MEIGAVLQKKHWPDHSGRHATISADIHNSVMALLPEEQRDRFQNAK